MMVGVDPCSTAAAAAAAAAAVRRRGGLVPTGTTQSFLGHDFAVVVEPLITMT
jgi:hypothetical protein